MILCNSSADSQQPHHPRSSNTGVASSNLRSGGVDYLRYSCWGKWTEKRFNRMLLLLQLGQERARSNESGSASIEATTEGDNWEVLPHGSNTGLRHKFVVRWRDVVITFSGRQVGLPSHPNVQVEMASTHLMSVGCHIEAYGQVMAMLRSTGMEVERTTVSRIDLCVDLVGRSMREFQDEILGGQSIRRATKYKIVGGRDVETWQTFETGKKNMIRIYDKVEEVKSNPRKLAIMRQRRWGKCPDSAVRVEFQVTGDKLQKIGCGRSVGEVFANLGAITDYFTGNWFRLADRRLDRKSKNQSKPGNSELWNNVVQAFHDWIGADQGELTPVTISRQTKDQTLSCLLGYASKWVAMNTVDQDEIDDIVTELFDWLSTGMFDESVAIKRCKVASSQGVLPEESMHELPF